MKQQSEIKIQQDISNENIIYPIYNKVLNEIIIKKITTQNHKVIDISKQCILGNIELLYSNIKIPSNYFTLLNIFILVIMILNNSIVWNFYFIFANRIDYDYCYNPKTRMLELTIFNKICGPVPKDNRMLIYLNNTNSIVNSTNINVSINYYLEELNRINQIYSDLLFDISLIYDPFKSKFSKIINVSSNNFSPCVILNSQSQFNFSFEFQQYCSAWNNILIFLPFIMISSLLSNFVLSAMSDIFGRLKGLKIGLIFVAIGGISIFILRQVIRRSIEVEMAKIDKSNYMKKIFEYFILPMKQTEIVNFYFSKLKVFYGFSIFFILAGQNVITNTSLSLILENSLSDELVIRNFLFYFTGITLSSLFTFAFNLTFESSELLFFVIGIADSIFLIFAYVYILESPRFYFEYSEYEKMTEIFIKMKIDIYLGNYVQDIEKTKDLINPEEMSIIKIKKEKLRKSSLLKKIVELRNNLKLYSINNLIDRNKIIRNPFLLLSFIYYEKGLNRKFFLECSLTVLVIFIDSIVTWKLFGGFYFTREMLYQKYRNIVPSLITVILRLIFNYFFYYIHKFFGFKVVLTISFVILAIMSILIELTNFFLDYKVFDQNKYDYSKINILKNDENSGKLLLLINIACIFTNGLVFSMYLHLFKFTKTINRCVFFGLIGMTILNIQIFNGVYVIFVSKIGLSIFVASVIGIIITFIVDDDIDEMNLITDRKILEIKNY